MALDEQSSSLFRELYAAILNSDHPRWSEYGENTRIDLSNLIMLGIERMHPITLAVVTRFSKPELQKAIYYLVCASVRILIASPAPGGTFEQRIADVAPRISTGAISTAKELAAAMGDKIVPSDAVFETEFGVANVSLPELARYYLRALENANANDEFPARVARVQIKGNIEHVLPANPGVGWDHIPDDTAKALYKRIGNLALMNEKDNADIGNQDFVTVKVPVLRAQVPILTQEIGEYLEWNEDTIEKRQRRLAQLAVKTWPATAPK